MGPPDWLHRNPRSRVRPANPISSRKARRGQCETAAGALALLALHQQNGDVACARSPRVPSTPAHSTCRLRRIGSCRPGEEALSGPQRPDDSVPARLTPMAASPAPMAALCVLKR